MLQPSQADLPRDTREPGCEKKHLQPPPPLRQSMREVQEHAGVALHRSADVAEQHERARFRAAPAGGQGDDLAGRSQAAYEGTADIHTRPASPDPAASAALTGNPCQLFERQPRTRDLFWREIGKILVGQAADFAPHLETTFCLRSPFRWSGPRSSGGRRPADTDVRPAAVRASRTRVLWIANGLV